MSSTKMNRSKSPKEVYVKVMNLSSRNSPAFDISKIKEEYDREGSKIRSWNVFFGGGIGFSIGLIACFATTAVGVPISSPEILTIAGGSLLFGTLAGFILR